MARYSGQQKLLTSSCAPVPPPLTWPLAAAAAAVLAACLGALLAGAGAALGLPSSDLAGSARIVDVDHMHGARAVVREVDVRAIPRLGVHERGVDAGRHALGELGERVRALLEKQPVSLPFTEHIFSFLPAKAGVGASTAALNVAAAMTRAPNARVLLVDFDLSSGMQRFLLNLRHEYSVLDAVQHAH